MKRDLQGSVDHRMGAPIPFPHQVEGLRSGKLSQSRTEGPRQSGTDLYLETFENAKCPSLPRAVTLWSSMKERGWAKDAFKGQGPSRASFLSLRTSPHTEKRVE